MTSSIPGADRTHGASGSGATRPVLQPRPDVAPPALWSFPTATEQQLTNGMRVIVDDLPRQKVISAALVLDVPLSAENRSIEGVATICSRCLDEGTQQHPGEQFARALEGAGGSFGIDVGLSGLQLIMDVPAGRLDRVTSLFAEAVRTPALTDPDISRHINLRLAEIEQARANSAQSASIAFRSSLFSADSRASRMNGGEPETLRTLTSDAVRAFHAEQFDPSRATLLIGGDFESDPLTIVESAFGGWVSQSQRMITHRPQTAADRTAVIIDRPGAVQADLRFGGFGIDRRDPRWAALTVAGHAVGGAFLSRLNSVLREERGYTYGVSLTFNPMRTGGSFAMQGSFRTEVAAAALAEAQLLLDIADRPITAAEVDNAQRYYAGVSPLRFATADGVVDQRAAQLLAALPADYIDRHAAALRQVTPETASQAYAEIVRVADLSLVVVGDADLLVEPLASAGFADIRRVEQSAGTADGRGATSAPSP